MAEILKSNTFNLFSMPSFLKGFGRVLDIGATMDEYNYSASENEADIDALKGDWKEIGKDLQISINNYRSALLEK